VYIFLHIIQTIYMKKRIGLVIVIFLSVIFTAFNVSCSQSGGNNIRMESTKVNYEDESVNSDNLSTQTESGAAAKEPTIAVYLTSMKKVVDMKLEDYIAGVVAGEMYNSWDKEALKAQAVLARTFTYDFLSSKNSKYKNADISTDITEAQAYDESNINDAIKEAVQETRGQVLMSEGEFVKAWFHSNSGGKTTTADIGLNYTDENPKYIQSTVSPENADNSQNFTWSQTFNKTDVLNALRKMGVSVASIKTIKVGERSADGRAVTLVIGGREINTNTFRLNIGSTKMKSTLIIDIKVNDTKVIVSGKGYGHGVGMSQWGAKVMAANGKMYDEILMHYFKNTQLKTLYK